MNSSPLGHGHAFGKVILFGEHAVVYGTPAIAAGLERGALAQAAPSAEARLTLGDQSAIAGDATPLGRAFEAILQRLGASPLQVSVSLEIPAGAGLGASAAIGVAIARAVLDYMQEPARPERVLLAASAWEQEFHGNPSGVDAAAATYGGCIWFSRAEGAKPLRLGRPLKLAVALAGPPASTRLMVENVAQLKLRRPEVFQKTLQGIESLVQNARHCLTYGDLPGLGQLMNLNQILLSGLFVSTEGIERACQVAREAGAFGAKLTGAGGGGAVIALAESPELILEAWQKAGVPGFASVVQAHASP